MRISNNFSPYFSKNQTRQKADNILRRIQQENLNGFSPTYAEENWFILNSSSEENNELNRKKLNATKTLNRLTEARKETVLFAENMSEYFKMIFQHIEQFHTGNCGEKTILAIPILMANGFENVQEIELKLRIDIFNNSHRKLYSKNLPLDHTCIVLNSNKNPSKKIIVDPWLDKVMSYSESKQEFYKIFILNKEKKYLNKFIEILKTMNIFTPSIKDALANGNYKLSIETKELENYFDKTDISKITSFIKTTKPNLII